MRFSIRAMSLLPSIPVEARVDVEQLLGKKFDFRTGLSYSLTLPNESSQFSSLEEPERLLTALNGWARVYIYPDGDLERVHVVAPSEDETGSLIFYRLDFEQQRSRRG